MIRFEADAQGLATLTWDTPGNRQNVINGENCAALSGAVERCAQDSAVKGIVLTSAKPDFIVGADLQWLLAPEGARQLWERTMAMHRVLRRLETCGKPVAAALPGSALGAGLEIALAAHYRVAADKPLARLGLPEVTLGLVPAGGGTQRLARLIGIQAALPLLLEGRRVATKEALDLGLLNAVVPAGSEVQAARSWLLAQTAPARQPWDAKGLSIPGGAVASPAVQQLFMLSNALLRARTLAQAPANILSCVYEGLITDIDTGLKTEASYFVHTLLGAGAKSMIRSLFASMAEGT